MGHLNYHFKDANAVSDTADTTAIELLADAAAIDMFLATGSSNNGAGDMLVLKKCFKRISKRPLKILKHSSE